MEAARILHALACGCVLGAACAGPETSPADGVPWAPPPQAQAGGDAETPEANPVEPGFYRLGSGLEIAQLEPDTIRIEGGDLADDGAGGKEKGELFAAPVVFHAPNYGWGFLGLGGYIFSTDPENPETPPSTVALSGFYAENDSFGGFGLARIHTVGDAWRLKGAGGGARSNYNFYGVGSDPGDDGRSLPFRTEFYGGLFAGLKRVSESWFIGPAFQLWEADTRLRSGVDLPPELRPDEFDFLNTALGAHAEYDTRDNPFAPQAGSFLKAKADYFSEAFGGDATYQSYEADYARYHELTPDDVLAGRLVSEYKGGGAPFFDLSAYELRGYEPGRYRDGFLVAGELEYRRHLLGRFGAVAFVGLGGVAPRPSELHGGDLLPSAGVGVRMRLTEKNPLNYRIDVAVGRNDVFVYVSVGEAF